LKHRWILHGRSSITLAAEAYRTDGAVPNIVRVVMKSFRKKQPLGLCWLCAFLLLSACKGTEFECDSLNARSSVVEIISADSQNALVEYAVKHSSSVAAMVSDTRKEAEKLAIWEKARQGAIYELDKSILTNSVNRATGAVSCSGLLSVTVGDTTAQKQVDFRIERAANGSTSVSVNPFLF
jgi:hypothetical protein